jgi:hypothetical protein
MRSVRNQKNITWHDDFLQSLRGSGAVEDDSDDTQSTDSGTESESENIIQEDFITTDENRHEKKEQIGALAITQPEPDFSLSLPTDEGWVLSEDLAFLDKLVRETYPERIRALQFLKNMLKSNNVHTYFDEEDRAWVEDDLLAQIEELKKLNQIWKETTSVYQNTLLRLASTIEVRQKVLSYVDDKTDVFSQRPKLVERFAKKQAELTSLMEVCKEKIRLEQEEVRERVAKENADQMAVFTELEETVIPPAELVQVKASEKNITATVEKVKNLVNEKPPNRKRSSQNKLKSKPKVRPKHHDNPKKVK